MAKSVQFLAKMVLDSKQFENGIQHAQGEIKKFQSSAKNADDFISSFAGSMTSAIGKFAGWAGAGLAAAEGLNKFMKVGQQTGDWIEKNVNIWKGLFDGFFISLNNGSVEGFVKNMQNVAGAIAEATSKMDDFNDAEASMDVWETAFQVRQEQLLNLIKLNKNNPELVKQYQQELRDLETERKTKLGNVQMMKEDAILAAINAQITQPLRGGQSGIKSDLAKYIMDRTTKPSIESLKQIMTLETAGVFGEAVEVAENMAQVLSGHVSQSYAGRASLNGAFALTHGTRVYGEAEQYTPEFIELIAKYMNSYQKKFGVDFMHVLKWNTMADTPDDSDINRKFYREQITEWYQLLQNDVAFQRKNIRGLLQGESGGSGKDKPIAKVGSIAYLDQEIKKLKELYNFAITDDERLRILQEIAQKQLEKEQTIALTAPKLLQSKGIKDLRLNAQVRNPGDIGRISPSLSSKDMKPPHIVNEEDVDVIGGISEGLGGVANLLGTITGLTDENTGAWLNWSAQTLGALQGVFKAMQSVGIASAASSAAQGGPLGWLSMGLAVAQAIAVFATIPKFAMGGIVPGTSYTGDKVIAGLNSGEMVLNHMQQARLFAMLNGASAINSNQVELKVRGTDLVAVLNNYNSRRARIV